MKSNSTQLTVSSVMLRTVCLMLTIVGTIVLVFSEKSAAAPPGVLVTVHAVKSGRPHGISHCSTQFRVVVLTGDDAGLSDGRGSTKRCFHVVTHLSRLDIFSSSTEYVLVVELGLSSDTAETNRKIAPQLYGLQLLCVGERSTVMSPSVCLCVCLFFCLSTRVYQKARVQTSPNFVRIMLVAMARSSSDGVAITLPVWGMTSWLHIIGQVHNNVYR